MISLIAQKLVDPQFMAALLAAIAAAATVLTVALPMVEGDQLKKRMKSVAIERERIACVSVIGCRARRSACARRPRRT